MPAGFPAFSENRFPGEKRPTLFHPASPKIKATKPSKEVDNASMMSTSTFSSSVSLVKEKVKSKLKTHKNAHPYVSEQRKSMTLADKVNGEDKTRTLSPPSEKEDEKGRVLKDYILMGKSE